MQRSIIFLKMNKNYGTAVVLLRCQKSSYTRKDGKSPYYIYNVGATVKPKHKIQYVTYPDCILLKRSCWNMANITLSYLTVTYICWHFFIISNLLSRKRFLHVMYLLLDQQINFYCWIYMYVRLFCCTNLYKLWKAFPIYTSYWFTGLLYWHLLDDLKQTKSIQELYRTRIQIAR